MMMWLCMCITPGTEWDSELTNLGTDDRVWRGRVRDLQAGIEVLLLLR